MSPLTGVLTEAWALYRRFAGHFLLISFVIYLITAIIVALLSLAGTFGSILGGIVALVAAYVLQASLIKAVQDVRDGRVDLDLSQTVQAAVPFLLPVIGAAILAGIGIAIGLVLLIVPGLILLTFWSLIIPFIVLGGSGVFEAFGNSWRTVRGYAWRVFGTYVLVVLILIAFDIVLSLILSVLPRFLSSFVGNVVAGSLIAPFLALVATLIYYRLTAAHAGEPYVVTSPEGETVWEPPSPTEPSTPAASPGQPPADSTIPPPPAPTPAAPPPPPPPPSAPPPAAPGPGSTQPYPTPGPAESGPPEPSPAPAEPGPPEPPPYRGPEEPPPPSAP
jgi:hypothetical protein